MDTETKAQLKPPAPSRHIRTSPLRSWRITWSAHQPFYDVVKDEVIEASDLHMAMKAAADLPIPAGATNVSVRPYGASAKTASRVRSLYKR